jgi:hypothetical protein
VGPAGPDAREKYRTAYRMFVGILEVRKPLTYLLTELSLS